MAYNYSGVGGTLLFTGHLRDAIEQLLKAYGITSRKGLLHQSFVSASDIGEAYENLKDYKHALEFMKIARSIKDSMFNEQSDKKIQQLQFEYELGKKQNQIELLNKNKLIERSGREKQTVVMWGLIAVLLLFVAIVVLLYRSRRKEIRNKELILRQKEVLRLQAEKLSELNEFKDRTFSVLAHDLRGPLAAFTTTMQMLDENVITHDEFTELKPAVDKQLNSLNVLLDNLLKWSKSYIMGEIATQPVNVAVYAITAANIGLVQDAADKKKIRIINNIPVDITAFADEGQVDIVIRNLISNAIKFTREEGTVTLAAGKKADRTIITVTDNGVGMTEEQLKKLFTTSPDNTTYGTKGERGIGLGLLLCHEFIKANNGTIVVVSEAGKGTVFTIDLPGNS
ncbi:MAG: ATP-binding protein, partial [Taibaiella sp.]|nr:ATP-binding protein [Taibaiella sp.]